MNEVILTIDVPRKGEMKVINHWDEGWSWSWVDEKGRGSLCPLSDTDKALVKKIKELEGYKATYVAMASRKVGL